MTIKFKLKFKDEGFTLSQTLIQDAATGAVKADAPGVVQQHIVPLAFDPSKQHTSTAHSKGAGADPGPPDDKPIGTGPLGTGSAVTVIGPFIFMGRCKKPGMEHTGMEHIAGPVDE